MEEATTTWIVLGGLQGNEMMQLSDIQIYLAPHEAGLELAWWCIFFATLLVVIVRGFPHIRAGRRSGGV